MHWSPPESSAISTKCLFTSPPVPHGYLGTSSVQEPVPTKSGTTEQQWLSGPDRHCIVPHPRTSITSCRWIYWRSISGDFPRTIVGLMSVQNRIKGKITRLDKFFFHHLILCINLIQFPGFCEDDLHSIVRMGYSHNPDTDAAFHSQTFPGKDKKRNGELYMTV